MFRHGKPRTFRHNLRLASMLSFVAGMVNVAGVLAVSTLTTNVTGHFAFFAEEVARAEYQMAAAFLSYIFFFLFGAFTCGLMVDLMIQQHPSRTHTIPLVLEILILISVTMLFANSAASDQWVARLLLFAMGLQNALVTQISKATVRTTHLTGLFTDLGIELSQLIFYRKKDERAQLSKSIYLRIAIISCFFFGGTMGGLLSGKISIYTLLIAAAVLVVALIYDNLRVGFTYYRRKLKSH